MDKTLLKEKLVHQQELVIKELEEKISVTHSMVDIDESDTIDPEDRSHQYESGEMEALVRTQLQKARIDFETLKSLDFGNKAIVEPGALVRTEKFNFIVGFPAIPFEYEDLNIVGISEASPIYQFMNGKKVNESFEFGGNRYTIKAIY